MNCENSQSGDSVEQLQDGVKTIATITTTLKDAHHSMSELPTSHLGE